MFHSRIVITTVLVCFKKRVPFHNISYLSLVPFYETVGCQISWLSDRFDTPLKIRGEKIKGSWKNAQKGLTEGV